MMTALIILLINTKALPSIIYTYFLPLTVYISHPIFIFLPFIFKLPIVIILLFLYRIFKIDFPLSSFNPPSALLLLPTFLFVPFNQSISETSLLLFSYISCVSLDNKINASTLNLKNHRNRYFISLLRFNKVKPMSFSTSIQSNIKNITSSLLIPLMIYGGITKHMTSVLIILLSNIMFIYFILDKLFQSTFTQKSKLYNTRFNQMIMSYLPIFILSCFLSFRLLQTYLDISVFRVEIIYLSFIFVIVTILKKRNAIALVSLLVLTGCTHTPQDGFEVIDNTPMFYASMQSRETHEVPLNPSSILKVDNGTQVKIGDLLAVDNSTEYKQELERLNYQLKSTKTSKLLDKTSKTEKVKELEFEINLLKDSVNHKSKIAGFVSITDDTLTVMSTELRLALEITESEFSLIRDVTEYRVMNLEKKDIAHTKITKVIPNHSPQGTTYSVNFNDFEHNCYPYQSLIVTPKEALYMVPSNFVRSKDASFYVKDATKEYEVEALTNTNNMVFITKGIKEGMVLMPYE